MVFFFAFCSFLNICPLFVSFNLFCFRLIGRYVNIAVLYLRNGRMIKDNALTKACLCLFVKSIVFFVFFYVSFFVKEISLESISFFFTILKAVCAYI